MIKEAEQSQELSIPLYGELLQMTNDFNFSILNLIQKAAPQDLVKSIIETKDIEGIRGLVRIVDSSPYVTQLIDFTPLLSPLQAHKAESAEFGLLLKHLKQSVYDDGSD